MLYRVTTAAATPSVTIIVYQVVTVCCFVPTAWCHDVTVFFLIVLGKALRSATNETLGLFCHVRASFTMIVSPPADDAHVRF